MTYMALNAPRTRDIPRDVAIGARVDADVGATARRATPTVSASTRAPIDANRARAPSSRARGDDATGYAKARARERLSTTDDGRRERRAPSVARTDETRTR